VSYLLRPYDIADRLTNALEKLQDQSDKDNDDALNLEFFKKVTDNAMKLINCRSFDCVNEFAKTICVFKKDLSARQPIDSLKLLVIKTCINMALKKMTDSQEKLILNKMYYSISDTNWISSINIPTWAEFRDSIVRFLKLPVSSKWINEKTRIDPLSDKELDEINKERKNMIDTLIHANTMMSTSSDAEKRGFCCAHLIRSLVKIRNINFRDGKLKGSDTRFAKSLLYIIDNGCGFLNFFDKQDYPYVEQLLDDITKIYSKEECLLLMSQFTPDKKYSKYRKFSDYSNISQLCGAFEFVYKSEKTQHSPSSVLLEA
jgi:type I site-specific restriction endonuclease